MEAVMREKGEIESKGITVVNQLETMIGQLCFGNGILAMIFGIYFQIPCESVVSTYTGLILLYSICLALPIPLARHKLNVLVEHMKILAARDKEVRKSLDILKEKVNAEEAKITKQGSEEKLSEQIELCNKEAPIVDAKVFQQKITKIFWIVGCFACLYFVFLAIFLVRGRQNHCESAAKALAEAAKTLPKAAPKASPKVYKKHPKFCYYPYGCF